MASPKPDSAAVNAAKGMGAPRIVAEGRFARGGSATANYDVTADGRRMLLVKPTEESPPLPLIVVENWFTELRQKVGQ